MGIRGAFHHNFPGFSGLGFHRKLARTKTQQGTYKASKHNRSIVFSRVLTGSDVINFFFYHLSSLFILLTSPFCAQLTFFASASATNTVRHPLGLGRLMVSSDRVSPWLSMIPILQQWWHPLLPTSPPNHGASIDTTVVCDLSLTSAIRRWPLTWRRWWPPILDYLMSPPLSQKLHCT